MIQDILSKLSAIIEGDDNLPKSVNNGEEFEDHILKELQNFKVNSVYQIKDILYNGKQSFPDFKIILENNDIFGLEIKFSASGNWSSKGNSVFETNSNKDQDSASGYKEIYVFFGRKPKVREQLNNFQVKYNLYGDCIDRIEVTHSPRFSINMEIGDNNLFQTIDNTISYTKFRALDNEKKNAFLRKYFNALTYTNEADRWYVDKSEKSASSDSEIVLEPIPFASLKLDEKRKIISESFILFMSDLFKDKANYSNVINYMIKKHFVYSSSLRDSFSSGGKAFIIDECVRYPQILNTFYNHQDTIKFLLKNPSEQFETECFDAWETSFGEKFIDRELSLEENFRNIISNFSPTMEIETLTPNNDFIKTYADISLKEFCYI